MTRNAKKRRSSETRATMYALRKASTPISGLDPASLVSRNNGLDVSYTWILFFLPLQPQTLPPYLVNESTSTVWQHRIKLH